MINKIQISDIATYKSETIMEPKRINFIYGGNGTGKTTLSRLFDGRLKNQNSFCEWDSQDHEKVIVYNRDFIEDNFSEDKTLPGIFTLGSESIDIQNDIECLKKKRDEEKNLNDNNMGSLEKLKNDLEVLRNETKEKCWEIETKYGADFQEALTGFRSSKEKFFNECLLRYKEFDNSNLIIPTVEQLKDIYRAAYTKDGELAETYIKLDASNVEDIDNQPLLSKVITGKANTPIGAFIQFLEAGDWVKQGLELSEKASGKCPFCQRDLPEDLTKKLEDFFDEEYENDCKALASYQRIYSLYITDIENKLKEIFERKYDFIHYDELNKLADYFQVVSKQNAVTIESKIETPSKVVEITPIGDTIEKINEQIGLANEAIEKNNEAISNQNEFRKKCQAQVWQFILNQLESIIANYNKKSKGLSRGIENIERQIKERENSMVALNNEIKAKEAELTSVLPTVNAINNILEGFGFTGFSLAENKEKPGTYLVVRPDGSDASKTLSEGEYNFIAFLYFYHLCFGSQTNVGITADKIVVIDDPISSLDSNVLFVIATLVRSVIENCRKQEKGIKQIFVLTHNIYFHKEVTFLGSRESFSPKEVAYFIIRKKDEISTIVPYQDNPIKTSYEILWEELRNPTEASVKSAFNSMRRILEHYFQVIGGIKYEDCINKFEGEDKLICKALIAFINDGSHSIFDDLIVSFDESSLENYMRVFRLIFEKLKHIDHYNMMMGIQD